MLELEAYEAEQMQTEKEKARRQARSQTLFNSLKMNQAGIPSLRPTTHPPYLPRTQKGPKNSQLMILPQAPRYKLNTLAYPSRDLRTLHRTSKGIKNQS